jgi:hypothetical protein
VVAEVVDNLGTLGIHKILVIEIVDIVGNFGIHREYFEIPFFFFL